MIHACVTRARNLPDMDRWPKDPKPDAYARVRLVNDDSALRAQHIHALAPRIHTLWPRIPKNILTRGAGAGRQITPLSPLADECKTSRVDDDTSPDWGQLCCSLEPSLPLNQTTVSFVVEAREPPACPSRCAARRCVFLATRRAGVVG